jgi:hypothetical protein
MAVSVRAIGELDRDKGRTLGVVEAGTTGKDRVYQLAARQLRQELVDDHPLVVPGERAPRVLEQALLVRAVAAKLVDEPVVRSDERDLHLIHENMRVVAGVDDDRGAFLISGDVAAGFKQLRRVIPAVQVRCPHRSRPVERLKIGLSSPQIRQKLHFGVLCQG